MKKLITSSERVKACDLHPDKPWVLSSLFDGKLVIMNYKSGETVKSFEVSDLPIRAAKFVVRERWIICGGDEMSIVVVNYSTGQKKHTFEAHQDYIRSITVHPTKSYVISCADDLLIKMWDWEKKWECVRTFEAHSHFIMEIAFNPKDPNMFASASLDSTVRMWNINSSTPSYTLEGHKKGINSVAFYHGKDKPFLVTGSDDKTVKIWDYQTKACIQTLEGHSANVSVVCFHPRMGYILSGSEDECVNIWNNHTYQLEERLTYGFGRVWAICGSEKSTVVAIGLDSGTIVLSLGKEVPYVSMDKRGKVVFTRKNEVNQIVLRKSETAEVSDGERFVCTHKELGIIEINPQKIRHDDKGRYVAVCGDGEYVIYKAVSWTNQSFGTAEQFVWGVKTGEYAVLDRSSKTTVFKNFKVSHHVESMFSVEKIFGGHMLGIKSRDFIFFYDWASKSLIQNIEVSPNHVSWSDNGKHLVLSTDEKIYFLAFDKNLVQSALNEGTVGEDGVEDCVSSEFVIDEKLKQGMWIGDCFIYINSEKALKYYLSGNITTVALLDTSYYLLGYVGKFNKIFLMDKEYNMVSYKLFVSVLQYQAYIIGGDFEAAEKIFNRIPNDMHNTIAKFLDKNGGNDKRYKEKALSISTDQEHRFKLSLELNKLEECMKIAEKTNSDSKWREIGSICLNKCKFEQAELCFLKGEDYPGLLLLYTTFASKEKIEKLAFITREKGKNNISFVTNLLLGKVDECVDILIETGRLPEAAFMARTYCPSRVSEVLILWKDTLMKDNEKVAKSLADPVEYKNLFPNFDEALEKEKMRKELGLKKEDVESPKELEEPEKSEVEVDVEEEKEEKEKVVEGEEKIETKNIDEMIEDMEKNEEEKEKEGEGEKEKEKEKEQEQETETEKKVVVEEPEKTEEEKKKEEEEKRKLLAKKKE